MGNTIMDLEYHVQESQLDALCVKKGSMTLIDANKKVTLIKQLGSSSNECCGGSVANSLFIATQLGHSGHHIGVIGSDQIGKNTISSYERDNIGHSFDTLQMDGDSGCCIVLITPDGERTMLTYLGVSANIHQADAFFPILEASHALFIEGYLLTDDSCYSALINDVIPHAKSCETSLFFTLSDAGLVHGFRDRFQQIIDSKCTRIFCNKSEAMAMSHASSNSLIWDYFRPSTNELIMTDGPNGATIFTQNDIIECPTTPVTVVDATGAGDAFAGTYIAMTAAGHSQQMSANLSNQMANIVVQTPGARPINLKELYHETISS